MIGTANWALWKMMGLGSAACFALMFMASPAFASDITNFGEFFSIFDPSLDGKVNDLSVSWLRMTFGEPIEDTSPTTLIGFALGRLNAAILAIGSMVLAYKICVGIMQTAHDGSILGRRWSTLWGPTRVAVGAAALVPLASGLCLAQALVLTIATMGVGLANHAWSLSLDGVFTYGKPLVAPNSSSKVDLAMKVFDVALCAQTANILYKDMVDAAQGTPQAEALPQVPVAIVLGDPYGGTESNEYETMYMNGNFKTTPVGLHADIGAYSEQGQKYSHMCGSFGLPGGLSGDMGSFTNLQVDKAFWFWQDNTAIDVGGQDFERMRIQAIQQGTSVTHGKALIGLMESLAVPARGIANNVVSGTRERYRADPDQFAQAIRQYDTAVANAVTKVFSDFQGTSIVALKNNAMVAGWVNAGAWYQQIAGYNASIAQIARSEPQVTPPKWNLMVELFADSPDAAAQIQRVIRAKNTLFGNLRAATRDLDDFAEQVRNDPTGGLGGVAPKTNVTIPESGSQIGDALRSVKDLWGSMLSGMGGLTRWGLEDTMDVNTYTDQGNPLGVLQRTGRDLEEIASLIVGGAFIGSFIPGLGSAADKVNSIGWFLMLPALTMGYLLPMMPWVMWISALIGWFILVCEAVIAAPLWALSHMRMDGEGLAGPLGEKGYFLLLSMLLRPVLMIIGFVLGMIMFNIFAGVTASGFKLVTASTFGKDGAGFMGQIFLFMILAGMYVWMAYKSFSLIHVVPDRILRWIGQGGEGLGEQEGMDQTKIIAMAALHQMSGGMSNLMRRAPQPAQGKLDGTDPSDPGQVKEGSSGRGGGDIANRSATQVLGDRRSTRQGGMGGGGMGGGSGGSSGGDSGGSSSNN